jgi:hypothetical protein
MQLLVVWLRSYGSLHARREDVGGMEVGSFPGTQNRCKQSDVRLKLLV